MAQNNSDIFLVKKSRFYNESNGYIDYKDIKTLQRYLSSMSKIEGKKRTGAKSKHQRQLARTLKRARHLALIPYVSK